jgi:hypothetical protein
MNTNTLKTITVGQLREELQDYSDDTPLFFGSGDLVYYRIKNRGAIGSDLAQVEFGTLYTAHQDLSGE